MHADHGAQFTSWAFTRRIREAGLMPSFGAIGDGYDALAEAFNSLFKAELIRNKGP